MTKNNFIIKHLILKIVFTIFHFVFDFCRRNEANEMYGLLICQKWGQYLLYNDIVSSRFLTFVTQFLTPDLIYLIFFFLFCVCDIEEMSMNMCQLNSVAVFHYLLLFLLLMLFKLNSLISLGSEFILKKHEPGNIILHSCGFRQEIQLYV